MTPTVTTDIFNRLSISIMEQFGENYEQSMTRLQGLTLLIICGPSITSSVVQQITVLSAVNSGKRAFLGGVTVQLPEDTIPHLTNLASGQFLSEAIGHLGGKISRQRPANFSGFTLTIGLHAEAHDLSLEMVCNAWQGGVTNSQHPLQLPTTDYLPLGAIAAAAIGVGLAFLKLSGIAPRCADFPMGISLWCPEIHWLDENAAGKVVTELPQKIWMLGLGHLGQAYLWNFAALPYSDRSKVTVMLQDYDRIAEANQSAGLLSEKDNVGQFKTMMARAWLDNIGFRTLVTERKFDMHTKREGAEPFIAVCGFDNAFSRQYLEDAGFDLVVEAGLGGLLNDFDDIVLHTFPNPGQAAKELWGQIDAPETLHPQVLKHFGHLQHNGCGMLPMELAGKAISSSFVGLLAGALVTGELIRASNCYHRYEAVFAQVRDLKHIAAFQRGEYREEAAQNGLLSVIKG